METLFIAGIAGLGGALAGGLISLISQFINRKWSKEDQIYQQRTLLYSKILSVGSAYMTEDAYKDTNMNISSALLICGKDLRVILVRYMKNLSMLINEIRNSKTDDEYASIIARSTQTIVNDHAEMEELMRKELNHHI